MAESGAEINHTQPNRCMVKFSPLNATKALARKNTTAVSWWMDRKYIYQDLW
jgi:putative transposase